MTTADNMPIDNGVTYQGLLVEMEGQLDHLKTLASRFAGTPEEMICLIDWFSKQVQTELLPHFKAIAHSGSKMAEITQALEKVGVNDPEMLEMLDAAINGKRSTSERPNPLALAASQSSPVSFPGASPKKAVFQGVAPDSPLLRMATLQVRSKERQQLVTEAAYRDIYNPLNVMGSRGPRPEWMKQLLDYGFKPEHFKAEVIDKAIKLFDSMEHFACSMEQLTPPEIKLILENVDLITKNGREGKKINRFLDDVRVAGHEALQQVNATFADGKTDLNRYINPLNFDQVYHGVGTKPQWFKETEATGKIPKYLYSSANINRLIRLIGDKDAAQEKLKRIAGETQRSKDEIESLLAMLESDDPEQIEKTERKLHEMAETASMRLTKVAEYLSNPYRHEKGYKLSEIVVLHEQIDMRERHRQTA